MQGWSQFSWLQSNKPDDPLNDDQLMIRVVHDLYLKVISCTQVDSEQFPDAEGECERQMLTPSERSQECDSVKRIPWVH